MINMKKKTLYGLMLLLTGFSVSSCSNLDESAYVIKPTDQSVIYSETFASSMGGFIAKSVTGDQVWAENTNGYVMMTGYVSPTNFANEDWLISPEIDLTNIAAAHLSFEHCARYFADLGHEATIMVSEGYKNDSLPGSVTWTELKTSGFSDPGSWIFNSSGQISLTQYTGKKIRIAFRYISTATKAGTWEMRNFLVEKGEAVVDNTLIYSESFAATLGGFTAQSISGAQTWGIVNGYAYMTGYVSPTNFANLDWLVSPEIDLSTQTQAHFQFDHVTRYFGALATEATVWISTDCTDGLSTTGHWTQVTTNPFFDPGAWTFSNSQKISLTAYAGQKIRIAFKYISTATKAGSWEIKNFKVYSGEANGIEAKPYTITQAIASQSGGVGWVQGYVVGYAWPYLTQNAYFFTADTCNQRVNVILADTTMNLYTSKIMAVQMPRGNLRNILNLRDNPNRIGQKIKLYGTMSPSYGIAGLMNVTKFVLPDSTANTSTKVLFTENFTSNLGQFTQNSVVGAQTWKWQSGFGATMSGFSGGNIANEDWLISPEIDMTAITSAALTFDHTINKGVVANMKTEQTLYVSTDNGVNWNKLTIPTYPAGTNWTFVNCGEISLDMYAGHKIKLAFKYICTTASSATWEVKNIQIFY